MAVLLSPVGGVAAQFFTNAGVPLSGGKFYTYAAGTSTPQATYTSGAGNVQHSNPIVLDAAGRVPTGEIWLTDGLSYKFVLKDANDVLIATYDNIVGINSNFVNFVNQQEIQTATAGQTVFTLTTMQYQVGTGNLSVFVDGVNQYGPGAQYAYTETDSDTITFVSGIHVGAEVKFTSTQIQNSGVADASQITYTYPYIGAVQQSVEEKLAQYISVKDFGAIGDGVTDDTDAIQAALDSDALYITGDNAEYVVTTINPKSNQTITDMRLLRKPTATQVSLEPVIKISGVGLTVENVTLQNIVINGNRQNLQDIYTGNGEDGGMHGFKIADGANNIKLINCAANYCGTAGLAVHSEGSSTSADYPITNIYLENFVATYNREHGMFGDSFDGLHINGMNSSYNGLTIAPGYSDTNGNTAFKSGGVPFGSGFDFECYLGYPLSYFKNVYASDVVCVGNSTSCMVYAPPVVDAVAEIPAENIFLKNVYFQKGVNAGTTVAFSLSANSYVGTKYGITNVHLSGYLDGYITSNNAAGFVFTDGFINVPDGVSVKGLINNGKNIAITAPSNKGSIQVETFGSPTVVKNTGAGTLSTYISQYVYANGKHSLLMPFSITGGTIVGGAMSWTITLPTNFTALTPVVDAYNTTSGVSAIANIAILTANTFRLFITPTDDLIDGVINLDVIF